MGRKHPKPKVPPRASGALTDPPVPQEATPIILDGQGPGLDKEALASLRDFSEVRLPFSTDPSATLWQQLMEAVLELDRIEGLIEQRRDGDIDAPFARSLQTHARALCDFKSGIANELIARRETTNQALKELIKQWLKGIGPTQSETTSRPRPPGGRPRKDEERKRIRGMKEAGKTWKEISVQMNQETGQDKSPEAYRSLWRSATVPAKPKKSG